MFETVVLSLSFIVGVASLICFGVTIYTMFQNDASTMAIVCLVLCLCGIGPLVAFIMGWIKSSEWGNRNLMLIWSVIFAISIMLAIARAFIPAGQ